MSLLTSALASVSVKASHFKVLRQGFFMLWARLFQMSYPVREQVLLLLVCLFLSFCDEVLQNDAVYHPSGHCHTTEAT